MRRHGHIGFDGKSGEWFWEHPAVTSNDALVFRQVVLPQQQCLQELLSLDDEADDDYDETGV